MNTLRLIKITLVSTVLGGLVAGCSIDPWEMGTPPSWLFPDGGQFDAAPVDSRPDAEACTPTVEVCDGTDNNCDSLVDNVDATLLADDADNCGTCGNICTFPFAYGVCVGGECQLGECFPSHWNINGAQDDGCEYSCPLTNDGVETCDNIDNDCDGVVDNGFDLQTDARHCGMCNRNCSFYKGTGACVDGSCELASCRGGYVDKDGDPDNGCECLMGITEGPVVCDEANPVACAAGQVCADVNNDGTSHCADTPEDGCDGVDNDCDGNIDEDAPAQLAGLQCYTNPAGGCTEDATSPGHYTCAGTCQAGTPVCTGGNVLCSGQVPPSVEVCDDVDNDCNGTVDDGYNKQTDPANCGGCGVRCASQLQHAVAGCADGQCYKISCLPGWTDLDGDLTPGCEYNCSITNGGIEACGDGVDNDCNGLVDDVDFASDPGNCGACNHACVSVKPFGTEVIGCLAGTCLFDCLDGYQDLDASRIEGSNGCEYFCTPTDPPDEICDGTDNDCNGHVDDGFVLNEDLTNCGACGKRCADFAGANSTPTDCDNGVCLYACLPGFVDLNGDVQSGDATTANGCEYACSATDPPDEICDGVDNDCNGLIDDGANGQDITRSCYTGPAGTAGVGPCRQGVQTCTGDATAPWNPCVDEVTPVVEICDGVDNDCNGETDDATLGQPLSQACYNGPAGTEDVGVCHGGMQTCTNGDWTGCVGEVTPGTESCDATDNDCDGQVDEDFDQGVDLLNCGGCGYSCLDHAGANSYAVQCASGTCQYACRPGHFDLDGDVQSGDATTADGCEYACSPTASGETCDGVDNNCDGQVDEGFDLSTNIGHCGACNYSCAANAAPNQAVTGCGGGVCSYACRTDFYDRDGDPANGCEYYCVATSPTTEVCDRKDNDCNGIIDDGVDINTDPTNCGACGVVCSATLGDNSVVSGCLNGVCRYQCLPGYIDRNGDVALGSTGNGCEYHCEPVHPGPEVCDGEDNDCDGQVDEGPTGLILTEPCYSGPVGTAGVGQCKEGARICTGVGGYGPCQNEVLPAAGEVCDGVDNDCDGETDEASTGVPLTQACYSGAPITQGKGECKGGTQTCSAGFFGACEGEVIPTVEICDAKDNDCDELTDEDFNKNTDLSNCGQCGYRCTAHAGANSYPTSCTGGVCQYVCRPNYYDRNGDVMSGSTGNGCESFCVLSNGGVEKCGDGIDNDCDGQIDEGFDLDTDLSNCGACGRSCAALAPANMVATTCTGGTCNYTCRTDFYDRDLNPANGCEYYCVATSPTTEVCDGKDNDCNGTIDDGFNVNTDVLNCGACGVRCSVTVGNNSQVDGCLNGVCRYVCVNGFIDRNGDVALGSGGDGCEYACTKTNGGVEICDGLDNDCDGQTDEGPTGQILTQACYSGDWAKVGVGPCQAGSQVCIGTGWGPCQNEVLPAASETCDGVDNDCDGETDEASPGVLLSQPCYNGAPGTAGKGECKGGTQTCTAGFYGACVGEVTPSSEICDAKDNDCDEQTDEDFNTAVDMSNCGACGYRCTAHAGANSYPTSCTGGVCQFVCRPNYYDRNGDVMSGSAGNGCEAYCVLSNGGVEKCGDGIDNDCDGQIDEGFDTNTDVENCGGCGYSCAANAAPNQDVTGCVGGVCQFTCKPNYYDYSATAPGCEYYCVPTNGGTEICDNVDNDCDGQIDQTFDKQTDVSHCGACNNACASKVVPNATVKNCMGGVCQFECNEHYYDLNGDLNSASTNGCEYFCNPTAPGVEVCDGEDNDCDGQKDKDAGGSPLTRACYSPGYGPTTGCTSTGNCVGTCREGQQTCKGVVGDLWNACLGDLGPATQEVCDNRDDDCDGQVDESFDKQTDINNCGACGASCWASRPAHTYPTGCVAGACQYACEPGYADLDHDLNTTGGTCEYQCPVYPPSTETCDGVDNDCDGAVDVDDPDLITPPLGFCFQGIDGAVGTPGTAMNNPCKGTSPQCIDPDGAGGLPKGWYCSWQSAVEVDPTNRNRILGYELRCNGLDGDCDGRPDDAWPLKGTSCQDDGLGVCQGSGTMVCDATGTDLACQITTPGDPPGTEACNGLDDDCDGVVDNDTPGQMMPVTIGATTYWVDVYEASRPDATELGSGQINDRACSEPGRLPWSNVSWDEADAACAAQGKRLCEEDEWQEACEGPAMLLYPYGNVYLPQYCNGNHYDPDCTGADDDYALATGTPYGCPAPTATRCVSPYGIVDMSGNVMEWTSTLVGTSSYRVRGGAFDNAATGLTCDFDFISLEPDFRYSTLGFRCCSDTDLTP